MTGFPNQKAYAKPPITEAVLELRTDEPFDKRDLERCRDRLKRQYEKVEELTEFGAEFVEGKAALLDPKFLGFKLTASNAVDVLMLTPTAVGTSRLAPYVGFDQLLAQTKTNFEIATKLVGRKRVSRIGARFINRLDVPNEVFRRTDGWSSFVRVQPSLPKDVAALEGPYYIHAQTVYSDDRDIKLTLQTGPMNPVLLDNYSLQLDIDVAYESNIPSRLDEMWEKCFGLRIAKNKIFESCITDAARELFR